MKKKIVLTLVAIFFVSLSTAQPDNVTVSMHLDTNQIIAGGQPASTGTHTSDFPYLSTSNAVGIVSENPSTLYTSNLSENLKAYYLLNSNGNDAENSYDGSVSGASFSSGEVNNAGDFDGNNDQIDLPNLGMFGDQSATVTAWIKVDNSAGANNNIFGFGQIGNTDQSFSLRTDSDGGFLFYFWGNDLGVSTENYYGEWSHVAATYNASTGERKIYLNGKIVGSDTTSSGNFQDQNYVIGGYNGQNFDGKIDELRVYTRELSKKEVMYTMNHRSEEQGQTVFSATSNRQGFLLPFNQNIGFENIDGQESAIKNNNFLSRTSPNFERLTRNDPEPIIQVAYDFPYAVNSTFGDITNAETLQIRNVPFTPGVQLELSTD